jgi:cytochrome c556
MRPRILIVLAVSAMLSAALLSAQSDSDYQGWMKTVGSTTESLRKNVAAKDAAAAGADVQTLQDTFKQVEMFWDKRGTADAVNFAKLAQTVLATVAKDAAGGNMDQAVTDTNSLAAACGGCHTAHRQKTLTGFKIK